MALKGNVPVATKRKEGRMGREELGFLPQFYHQSVAWLWIN